MLKQAHQAHIEIPRRQRDSELHHDQLAAGKRNTGQRAQPCSGGKHWRNHSQQKPWTMGARPMIARLFSVQAYLCGLLRNLSRYLFVGRPKRQRGRRQMKLSGMSPDTPNQHDLRRPDEEHHYEKHETSVGLSWRRSLPAGGRLPDHRSLRWSSRRVTTLETGQRHLRWKQRRRRFHQTLNGDDLRTPPCGVGQRVSVAKEIQDVRFVFHGLS